MEQINDDTISLHWTTEDVMIECDWLNKDQARHVLRHCLEKHDATIGLCWDVISTWACELYPKHSTKQM